MADARPVLTLRTNLSARTLAKVDPSKNVLRLCADIRARKASYVRAGARRRRAAAYLKEHATNAS
jgi:hypothetical protein